MDQDIQGLKPERIQNDIAALPGWQSAGEETTLVDWRQSFSSFNRIIEALVDIALLAERYARTPDITVQSNALTVRLGMNGLTPADRDLARAISSL